MKKRFIQFFVITTFISLLAACSNENNELATPSKSDNTITYTYVLDGVNYPVVMKQTKGNLFEPASEINKNLAKVLDLPTSTLLKDPFIENTYFVFPTQQDSKTKNAEIIGQLNSFEKNVPKSINSTNLRTNAIGAISFYDDRNYAKIMPNLNPQLIADGGYTTIGEHHDRISSYKVWSNTNGARPDNLRFVVRFYEHENYGGHVLTAYSFYVDGSSTGGPYQVSWKDANLHGTLMTGGFKRRYWGDRISSVSWILE